MQSNNTLTAFPKNSFNHLSSFLPYDSLPQCTAYTGHMPCKGYVCPISCLFMSLLVVGVVILYYIFEHSRKSAAFQLTRISKSIRKLITRVLSPSKCWKKTPFPHFNVEPPSEPAGLSTLGCMKMYVRLMRIDVDCCTDNPAACPHMCTLLPTHIHLSCLVSGITLFRKSTVDAVLHTPVPPMRSKRHPCHHFQDNQCLQAPTQNSRSPLDPCSLVLCLDKWGSISNTTNSTIST